MQFCPCFQALSFVNSFLPSFHVHLVRFLYLISVQIQFFGICIKFTLLQATSSSFLFLLFFAYAQSLVLLLNLKSWEACWPHSWDHIPKPRQLHGPAPARRHLHAPFTARYSCPPPVAHPLRLLIWGHCTSCLTMSRLSWTDHRVTHCLVLLLPPDPVRVTCSRHRDFKCGPCNTIGAGKVVICLNDKKPHVLRQAPYVCHPGWPPDWPWWPEPIPTSNHHVAEKILGHLLSWSVFLLTMFWWDFGFVFLFFSCLILSRLAPPELRRARRAESGVGYNRSGGLENAGKRMINAVHLIWN